MDFITPRATSMLDALADLEIIGMGILTLAFVIIYTFRFDFLKTWAGKAFVFYLGTFLAVLTLNIIGRFYGPAPDIWRFLVYGLGISGSFVLLATVIRYWRHDKDRHRQELQKMRNTKTPTT